jgi:hypothetical protein
VHIAADFKILSIVERETVLHSFAEQCAANKEMKLVAQQTIFWKVRFI